jgi:hypothetical protein
MIRLLGRLTMELSKNIRCFSNMRRLPSSALSSDSAISERWPVSSACLAITRWRASWTVNSAMWPAPGSEDTELGVLMELEVGHGETEVYARVQA